MSVIRFRATRPAGGFWTSDIGLPYPGGNPMETTFRVEHGSWSETPLGDGTVQTTFVALATGDLGAIANEVNLLSAVFDAISEWKEREKFGAHGIVALVHAATGPPVEAHLLGGAIRVLDEGVVTRWGTSRPRAIRIAVTFTRAAYWDGPVQAARFGGMRLTSGNSLTTAATWLEQETRYIDASVKRAGDNWASARVAVTQVQPTSTNVFQRVWLGMKRSPTGADFANFAPRVQLSMASVPSGVFTQELESDDYASNGTAKLLTASAASDWQEMAYSPWNKWNALLQALSIAEKRAAFPFYEGEYHALLRYKIQIPRGVTVGLQLATGYAPDYNTQQVKLNRHYLRRGEDEDSQLGTTGDGYHYLPLGKIVVGGMPSTAAARATGNNFSVALNAGVFEATDSELSANNPAQVYLDCIELIPAEQYLHMRTSPRAVGASMAMEYIDDGAGNVGAYVVRAADRFDYWLSGVFAGDIQYTITDYEATNWTVPGGTANVALVMVADNPPGSGGYGRGAWNTVRMETVPRNRGGFYG